MNTKARNLVIDIIAIMVVLSASYKEFFTDSPMPIWEWVIVFVVCMVAIALHTKDIKKAFEDYKDKKLGK